MELALNIALIIIYTAFSAIRIHYQVRAQKRRVPTVIQESRLYSALLSLLICYEVLTFFLYLLAPRVLAWASLPLQAWLRWSGLVLAIAALALFVWVHHHLGRNFSVSLRIFRDQALVTTGPYRWVRHPMYTAFLVLHVAAFLMTANWFIGITWMGGLVVILVLRVRREEAMMCEHFGEEYGSYMRRTGRLIPPILRILKGSLRMPGAA
ncbi:MAG: isoprenylcysteine carboxylmethyltransferase family protein [Thermoleophilia bacterium]|nr:isoprenylcysteine carboxylmethyltransferase family protein [Thermoleophilia bacterium]